MATLWLEIKFHKLAVYKKRAVEKAFSQLSVFSLFSH